MPTIFIPEASKYLVMDALRETVVTRKTKLQADQKSPGSRTTERDYAIPQLEDIIDQIN